MIKGEQGSSSVGNFEKKIDKEEAFINGSEVLEVFLYAANANPPHSGACLRCAEYYETKTPQDISNALHYYKLAYQTSQKPQNALRGLLKLHYQVGLNSSRKRTQHTNFQLAKDYGDQIIAPTSEDDFILDDLEKKLETSLLSPDPLIEMNTQTLTSTYSSEEDQQLQNNKRKREETNGLTPKCHKGEEELYTDQHSANIAKIIVNASLNSSHRTDRWSFVGREEFLEYDSSLE